jgi:hypothetical protein
MMWKKITYDRITQWAKRNPFLVILFVIVVIFSSLLSLLDGGVRLREIYRSTVGKNSLNYEKINALATQTNIDFFSSLLGSPVFKNRLAKYIEYIYVNSDFYVQAVTNTDGKILLYAVTTRSGSFNPSLNLGLMSVDNGPFVVVLGKTTFAKIQDEPIKIEGDWGVRRLWYREKYYFGNPGLYQNYNFVLCDAGFIPDDNHFLIDVKTEYKDREPSPRMKLFRETSYVNTFSVSAPFSDIDDEIAICPDLDQVRLLNKKSGPS